MVGSTVGAWCRFVFVLSALSAAACSNDSAARATAPPTTFVVELDPGTELHPSADAGVALREAFAGTDKSYAMVEAPSAAVLARYLDHAGVAPRKIVPVRDINSPVRGGGPAAGPEPRPGHKTFLIERKIPGVGGFPDSKKAANAKRANAAIAQLGDGIEWDHSYLTDEGTYCVYRAVDEVKIHQHAAISGAPVNKVSEVRRLVASQWTF